MAASTFWSDYTLQPKRKHKWLLYLRADLPAFVAKNVKKPSFEIGEFQHKFFGHSFYYPGSVEWKEMTMTLVDPMEPDVTRKLYEYLEGSGYSIPEKADEPHTISKKRAVDMLGAQVRLSQFKGGDDDSPIETFVLHNPWIKMVEFGDLDYTSDDFVEINLTLRYDYATLQK